MQRNTTTILFTSILLIFSYAEADPTRNTEAQGDIQQEINSTVWLPFKQAFETLDGTALNALYAKKVLRVTPEGIDTNNQFKRTNLTRFDGNKARGEGIKLDFWFASRDTNAHVSYEVGFYRIQIVSPDESKQSFYGQFHIVLQHTETGWKIVQDRDSPSLAGTPITAELFDSNTPIDLEKIWGQRTE